MNLSELSFAFEHIWQRVGKRTETHRDVAFEPQDPDIGPECGVVFFWPVAEPYLSLSASGGPEKFTAGLDGLSATCATFGRQPADLISPEWLGAYNLLSGRVRRGSSLSLELTIDTDDETFCGMAKKLGNSLYKTTVYLIAFNAKDRDLTLAVPVYVGGLPTAHELFGIPQVDDYDGYAALDLGNTTSLLVCLSANAPSARLTREIKVLDGEKPGKQLEAHAEPVLSDLRIDEIVRPDPDNIWHLNAFRYVIGSKAATSSAGYIPAPKRLVAGRRRGKGQRVRCLVHDPTGVSPPVSSDFTLPSALPAELLACKLLHQFRQSTCRLVGRRKLSDPEHGSIALTYPTSYSRREIKQLRTAVERGWLRMCVKNADKQVDGSPGQVRLLIDEASAAAYFFLYRRIFESPGGLGRFRYLYPDGLNLLLYDCGGGTTDIALVRAYSEPGSARLRLRVRGRSGLRGFGGDNITEAVFRILKAKIAHALAPKLGQTDVPALPDKAHIDQLDQFLMDHFSKINALVPTEFKPAEWGQAERERTLLLWQWADELKRQFRPKKDAPPGSVPAGNKQDAPPESVPIGDRPMVLKPLTASMNPLDAQTLPKLFAKSLRIHRYEIDSLISKSVEESVCKCNLLIRKCLIATFRDGAGDPPGADEEVHWVVVSGNAALYPMIEERLREKLNVTSINDGRFTLDVDNLKHAVAKGALLDLATRNARGMVRVDSESDLSECLPYNITYWVPGSSAHPWLFKEHQRYDDLKPQTVKILASEAPAGAPAQRANELQLEQHWPGDVGDDAYTAFLRFKFENGIRGDVVIRYDPGREWEFVATDSSGLEAEVEPVEEGGIYLSPVQRGKL